MAEDGTAVASVAEVEKVSVAEEEGMDVCADALVSVSMCSSLCSSAAVGCDVAAVASSFRSKSCTSSSICTTFCSSPFHSPPFHPPRPPRPRPPHPRSLPRPRPLSCLPSPPSLPPPLPLFALLPPLPPLPPLLPTPSPSPLPSSSPISPRSFRSRPSSSFRFTFSRVGNERRRSSFQRWTSAGSSPPILSA